MYCRRGATTVVFGDFRRVSYERIIQQQRVGFQQMIYSSRLYTMFGKFAVLKRLTRFALLLPARVRYDDRYIISVLRMLRNQSAFLSTQHSDSTSNSLPVLFVMIPVTVPHSMLPRKRGSVRGQGRVQHFRVRMWAVSRWGWFNRRNFRAQGRYEHSCAYLYMLEKRSAVGKLCRGYVCIWGADNCTVL